MIPTSNKEFSSDKNNKHQQKTKVSLVEIKQTISIIIRFLNERSHQLQCEFVRLSHVTVAITTT